MLMLYFNRWDIMQVGVRLVKVCTCSVTGEHYIYEEKQ